MGSGPLECGRCGEEEQGGEHRVFWCEEVNRPTRRVTGEETEREWSSWLEVDEWYSTVDYVWSIPLHRYIC